MRRVLITGGSSGIGKRIAQVWSQQGHQCHLISRNEERLQDTLRTLSSLQGQLHKYTVADICTDMNSISNLVEKESFDTVVHAAGITQTSLCVRTSDNEMENIINTNLLAPMKLSKIAVSIWLRQRAPKDRLILFLSSRLSNYSLPGTSAYAASKAALEAFTRVLATEVAARGIRVNAVAPGYTDTSMLNEQMRRIAKQRVPLGRLASTDEVADACTFLLRNSYATGTVLPIHGGL
ncbi:3-oxoacyl-[acyl-carrier-protein] reductase Oar2 [Schizosaccharomyces cryophilus OY26]|uniref:3-oxoacyl-[acyl-carrier-protein] reductase Oar2 n=1 Tax=Schizosaccharomyces cryophilus (strain OY26 / ATCC MYA-4695 / CBS 11777 / NBRC 106824 / NRRL Y48691) TaxID=653667 RepID=S9W0N1_SCHCR|nr:3-oxoacyl-[acyl-carrier-protein] reductase Oar2 [Schizosaccharomyces cryophilus OY26]EPY53398.1 3-oxoacyl-[acyl-carrier-protein] reductase Oar2 [Schizosaccharomyces cryophilus OY26]